MATPVELGLSASDDLREKTAARFWPKVDVAGASACWFWQAAKDRRGYGRFSFKGKNRNAHRISFELVRGPIPRGLELDHLCRAHNCVNPHHLEPVTHTENVRRGDAGVWSLEDAKARTHCKSGLHRWTSENIYKNPSGSRTCRKCLADYNRRWRAAQ